MSTNVLEFFKTLDRIVVLLKSATAGKGRQSKSDNNPRLKYPLHTLLSLCPEIRCAVFPRDALEYDDRNKKHLPFYFDTRSVSKVRMVVLFARGYLDVLLDHLGIERFATFPLKSLCSIFEILFKDLSDDEAVMVKQLKNVFTAAPMASYLGEDLPPMRGLTNFIPFAGSIRKYLKTRLTTITRKNTKLWFTVLQAIKRVSDVVPEGFVADGEEAHMETLCSDDYVPHVWTHRDEEVKRKYTLFFKGFRTWFKRDSLAASHSACFENARMDGGAAWSVLESLGYDPIMSHCSEGYLEKMIEVRPASVTTVYTSVLTSDLQSALWELEHEDYENNKNEKLEYHYNISDNKRDRARAHVVILREALKVRPITKGPALLYYLGKGMQKDLWRFVSSKWQFAPMREPLQEYHINDMLARKQAWRGDCSMKGSCSNFLVSGDYSAATDGIDPRHSMACLDAALQSSYTEAFVQGNMTQLRWFSQCRRIMDMHDLYYGDQECPMICDQNRGQLMGSVLSFPILCAINFCNLWVATEELLGYKVNLDDVICLVNGDDILFPSNNNLYDCWSKGLDTVGFKLSVGKNYRHRTVCTMNSQAYHLDHSRNQVREVKWTNLGLLHGEIESHGQQQQKTLCTLYNELMGQASHPIDMSKRFLDVRRDEIMSMSEGGRYNLYLSNYIGGLGFKPPTGWDYEITNFQHCLGGDIIEEFNNCISAGERPKRFFSLSEKRMNSFLTRKVPVKIVITPSTHYKKKSFIGPLSGPVYETADSVSYKGPQLEDVNHSNVESELLSLFGNTKASKIYNKMKNRLSAVRPPRKISGNHFANHISKFPREFVFYSCRNGVEKESRIFTTSCPSQTDF